MSELKENYEMAVGEYMAVFCKKQEMYFDYWVGDEVGEVAAMGDCFFNFSDIKRDIDLNMPVGAIVEWHWQQVDNHYENKPSINYRSYCMGLKQKKV